MEYSPRNERLRALLRRVREEAGLSQAALAAKLGRPQSYVCKAEIGERSLNLFETLDFCAACNVSGAEFIKRLGHSASTKKADAKPTRIATRKTTNA